MSIQEIPEKLKVNRAWNILWVSLFAIAMGYMESAVVVYLRTIYYPGGFSFPLKPLSPEIGITELFREAATMIMLLCVGMMAAKKMIIRFAFFIYAFAIWDIFYYLFLYVLVGWPSSLLEWDILFLIPLAWVGPVIAPVINSLTMIALALLILHTERRKGNGVITGREWFFLLAGSLVTIFAYTIDYMQYMIHTHTTSFMTLPLYSYVPHSFNWWFFVTGEILFITVLFTFWRRASRQP